MELVIFNKLDSLVNNDNILSIYVSVEEIRQAAEKYEPISNLENGLGRGVVFLNHDKGKFTFVINPNVLSDSNWLAKFESISKKLKSKINSRSKKTIKPFSLRNEYERFLLINGFTKTSDTSYSNPNCHIHILKKGIRVDFNYKDEDGSMYLDSHEIYSLIGVLIWFDLVDKIIK